MKMPGMTAEVSLDRARGYQVLAFAAAEPVALVRPAQYSLVRPPIGGASLDCDAKCLGSCGLACAFGLVSCAVCIGLCCAGGAQSPVLT